MKSTQQEPGRIGPVGSKVRSGITPTINALALMLIALTVIGAITYEVLRRRAERHERELTEQKERDEVMATQPMTVRTASATASGS